MFQQQSRRPPPPPGFELEARGGYAPQPAMPTAATAQPGRRPPPPPGFEAVAQQAPNPSRQAPSRPRPVAAPANAPMPAQQPLTDLGITADEEMLTLIRQGYSMDQAREMTAQPEQATGFGYRVENQQDLGPTDTPENLARLGYTIDPVRNVYAKTIGTEPAPGIATSETGTFTGQGQREPSPGYLRAMLQERVGQQGMEQRGLPGTFGQSASTMATPFGDEIAGALGFAKQGIGNIGRSLTGQPIEISAADRGGAMMDLMQEYQSAFQRDRPLQAGVGQVLGGFAMAPARIGVTAAARLGAQPAQNLIKSSQAFARPTRAQGYGAAAAAGGVYGAADANGDLSNRAIGGAVGAGAGVALLGALDGTVGAVSSLANRSQLSGEQRRVAQVINRELQSNRVNPQDYLASMSGAPAGSLPFNLQNGALSSAAEVLASYPGAGGRLVKDAVDLQRAQSGDRIMSRIGAEVGGEGNYFATLDGVIDQRRQVAKQVIDEIGPQTFRLNDNAVRSLRSDLAQGQLRNAAQNALASPEQATYEMGANIMRLADTLRDNPSAAMLDVRSAQDVSRGLLDMSNDAWRRGDGSAGKALGDIGRAVRNNARDAVPEYGTWLARYGDDSSQIEALQLGRGVFSNADDPRVDGNSAELLRSQFAEMSDTAKEMFRKGVGEAIVARARTSRGGVGAMRDLIRTEEFADRVRIAFPDERAFTRFMNAAEAEVGMANAGQTITGNSRTFPRQAAAQRMGAQEGERQSDQLSQATLTGIPLAVGRAGLRAAGRGAARNRSVLENENLNELFGRALTDENVLRQLLQASPRRPNGLFGGRLGAPVGTLPQTAF